MGSVGVTVLVKTVNGQRPRWYYRNVIKALMETLLKTVTLFLYIPRTPIKPLAGGKQLVGAAT